MVGPFFLVLCWLHHQCAMSCLLERGREEKRNVLLLCFFPQKRSHSIFGKRKVLIFFSSLPVTDSVIVTQIRTCNRIKSGEVKTHRERWIGIKKKGIAKKSQSCWQRVKGFCTNILFPSSSLARRKVWRLLLLLPMLFGVYEGRKRRERNKLYILIEAQPEQKRIPRVLWGTWCSNVP